MPTHEELLAESEKRYLEIYEDVKRIGDEAFGLHLNWIDKVITLSVSIIGASITAFIALKEQIILSIGSPQIFFWMWFSFSISVGTGIAARIMYAHGKITFANSAIGQMNKQNLASHIISFQKEYDDAGRPPISHIPKLIEEIEKLQKTEDESSEKKKIESKKWSARAGISSKVCMGSFCVGIILFLVIGYQMTSTGHSAKHEHTSNYNFEHHKYYRK